MATYDDLRFKIQRMLQDIAGKQYPSELLFDGIVAAHDEILPWVPKFAVAILTSGSGGGLLNIPDDLYQVDAVQDLRNNQFLPKATLAPKLVRSATSNVDWIDYPNGYISINENLQSGTSFKLFYRAYWQRPSSDSDGEFQIEVPKVAHVGMLYYACAYAVTPRAVTSAGIRQFNTRVDSGQPEDNPLFEISDYFRKLFYAEMKMMAPFTKAVQV